MIARIEGIIGWVSLVDLGYWVVWGGGRGMKVWGRGCGMAGQLRGGEVSLVLR